MQKVLPPVAFVLLFGFLAVETYRDAIPEHRQSYGGPTIHWSTRY